MGCSIGAEESEGAVERTLGRGTLSGHSGVILIVNRIRECSGVIDERKNLRKEKVLRSSRSCSQPERQARPSPRRDWCETRQAQSQVCVDRAEPEMGDGSPSRSRL